MGVTNFDEVRAAAVVVAGVTIDGDTLAVNDLTASAAEINQVCDGVGADVTAANLDELTGGTDTALHTHALADGASDVTASAAELNVLDGITATVAELNVLDGITASVAELNKLDGAGAAVASGTQAAHIVDVTNTATGTELATAINAILDALEAFGIAATS